MQCNTHMHTRRLFPDGPSAATQAHAAPVVHPLLMRQPRAPGSAGSGGRSSGRGSRSSRAGGGGTAPNALQQAALGLLPSERLIWDSHGGAGVAAAAAADGVLGGVGGGAMGMPEQALMDAIEVCMCVCVMCIALEVFVENNTTNHWHRGNFIW